MSLPRARILAVVFGLCLVGPAFAQTPGSATAPTQTLSQPPPPAAQAGTLVGTTATPGPDIDCQTQHPAALPSTPVDQDEAWNPRGGEVTFTFHDALGRIPANAIAIVCFRWAHSTLAAARKAGGEYLQSPLVRNVPSDQSGLRKLLVTVPDLPGRETGTLSTALGGVPLAQVRIIMVDPTAKTIVADEIAQIGITDAGVGAGITIFAVSLAFLLLAFVGPVKKVTKNLFLRVLAADDGHASISQFQLLLWTFVIGASAIYVMSLSGELIDISSQVLILLGITGAANLGARTTGPAPAPGALSVPHWSDLITNSSGAVDPSRVQMLFFTLITAVFVLIYVLSAYEVPDIPNGFLILMGISNTVYVGAKVVTPGGATPGSNPAPSAAPPATGGSD
jgi:hypothetical protein